MFHFFIIDLMKMNLKDLILPLLFFILVFQEYLLLEHILEFLLLLITSHFLISLIFNLDYYIFEDINQMILFLDYLINYIFYLIYLHQ